MAAAEGRLPPCATEEELANRWSRPIRVHPPALSGLGSNRYAIAGAAERKDGGLLTARASARV
jgi:hypothetical protein